jgi:hypothetical protein
VHDVDFMLQDGVIFQRWTINAKETAKARRAAKRVKSETRSRR